MLLGGVRSDLSSVASGSMHNMRSLNFLLFKCDRKGKFANPSAPFILPL